ncbi:MAG: YARHG domain-containing protein [Oscillospiraceae bacterium]|nr:YARHG domain-containing protein [Oscillospiraceae bacterium]
MTVRCPNCGAQIQSGQRFCVDCGTVLAVSAPGPNDPELDLSDYFEGKGERSSSSRRDMDQIFAMEPDHRQKGAGKSGAAPAAPAAVPVPAVPNGKKTAAPAVPNTKSAPVPAPAERKAASVAVPGAREGAARPLAGKEKKVPARAPADGTDAPGPVPGKKKGSKALDVALIVCSILAIAVVTFVLILLFWPGSSTDRTPSQPVATLEPAPVLPSDQPDEGPATIIQDPALVTGQPGVVPTTVPVPAVIPTTAPTATPEPVSEYLLPDSDSRYLTDDDIKGLSHEQLCFARNEIFARHGRIFKTPQIAAYFNAKSWYRGTVSPEDFRDSVFNAYEKANIALIAAYEKKVYGGSYY